MEAKKFDLNYIGLDGDVACMVNGAGKHSFPLTVDFSARGRERATFEHSAAWCDSLHEAAQHITTPCVRALHCSYIVFVKHIVLILRLIYIFMFLHGQGLAMSTMDLLSLYGTAGCMR